MRDILFRGRRIDNGEWVEGLLTIDDFALRDKGVERRYCIKSVPHDIGGSFVWVPVIPATIGQFTGLKDKNGRRIFEGDIVHMKGGCVSAFGAVEFRNGSFGIADAKRKRFYLMDDHSVYRVEGNIHDNPELFQEV